MNWWSQDRLNSPELLLNSAALLVGVGTGFGAVLFIWLLKQVGLISQLLESWLPSPAGLLIGMAGAGLIVGVMIDRWALEAKGHGVPEVMEAIALHSGRIRTRVAAVKVLASSLTIGFGGSAGREGPIVQVGSALGSTVGQRLKLSDDAMSTLVACGSAAGIAATFNAPIAGSLFALEVILGRFTVRHFGSVVLSSVAGSIVSRAFLTDQVAFRVPAYPLNHLGELPIYVVLSVLAAITAVLFIRSLYFVEHLFDEWAVPLPLKTITGMVATGAIALLLPNGEILGSGIHLIGEAIAEDFAMPLGMMAALILLKLLATTATLGSGNSGGVFAPSLFMGAGLGGIVGTAAQQFWPTLVLNPGAYAIVGMAAVFSAAAQAPITAILIVFEMSNDYQLILPLMLATVLATLLAEQLFPDSIYSLKLARRGIRLQRGRDEDILAGITVGEAMQKEDMVTLSDHLTLRDLSLQMSQSHQHGFPIVAEDGSLTGIVTLGDLEDAIQRELPQDTFAAAIGTPRAKLVTLKKDATIGEALQKMGRSQIGRIPIVAHDNPNQLVGLITRYDIVNAYNMGLNRRAELQHRTKQLQRKNIDGTEFVEVMITAVDAAHNQTIRDVAVTLPQDCVLVSIRRGKRLLIPHGDTRLLAGDKVTAFVAGSDKDALLEALQHHTLKTQGAAQN